MGAVILKEEVWNLLRDAIIFEKILVPFDSSLYSYLIQKQKEIGTWFEIHKIGDFIEIRYKKNLISFRKLRKGKKYFEVIFY